MTDDIVGGDAFDALRRPDAPIAPSDAFAKQLRQRLTAELAPLLTVQRSATTAATALPKGHAMTVTPYLVVRNAAAALDFYRDAFGAIETERLVGDDGRVGHAQITIGASTLMLADEYPEVDALGPQTRGGPTCSFQVEVDDVDAAFAQAIGLGARSLREPADQFHGNRSAIFDDPFGQRWTVTQPIEQLSTVEYAARAAEDQGFGSFSLQTPADPSPHDHQARHHLQGDLYYFTLPVPDVERAQRFFGAVLGWQFDAPGQGHVNNIAAPPGGLNGESEDTGARLWFVVDDIHAAVARVRELGGTAQEPVDHPSGWSSDCTDDQGTVFSLSVPSPAYSL
jgi:uncharacterized glyoxalase superfamily protein PhnB